MDGLMIRSRAKWAEKGEKSNKHFFSRLKSREKSQSMASLLDENGKPEASMIGISKIAGQFYQNLFTSEPTNEASQEFMLERITSKVSEQQASIFEFYKKFELKVAKVLLELFNNDSIEKWNNDLGGSVITLLPKSGDIRNIRNWRPISLSNCDEKILTKILANRIQKVMMQIIHPSQCGFTKGRSIMDNILLKKFIIDEGKRKNTNCNGYVVMLDQEKAYDRVDWEYMYKCLTKMGIGTGFTRYLRAIYTGAKTRIKINGGLTEPMEITRGLRQGDPLSLLLYNIVIEPLLAFLRSMLKGIKTTSTKFTTSAYADDISVGIRDKSDAEIHNWD
ncbi:Transposon TX1 uncharacterized [Zancudomyces culisetae]|uniref:Transposon TX1 uncharacterized n=1 Tax=Zancudomyces culisetae TaxID=1213189 RepID=A0A1R1PY77_ZANCU|nr:Transposon TX1 uncharacterized [Zancudomyces culisetae]|eukprot:OMH85878.1 Transposon TX1 uncharacterized [Zancudomyces culisetae]